MTHLLRLSPLASASRPSDHRSVRPLDVREPGNPPRADPRAPQSLRPEGSIGSSPRQEVRASGRARGSCWVVSLAAVAALAPSASAQRVRVKTPLPRPQPVNQGPDQLLASMPNYTLHGNPGDLSYNGQSRAFAVVENANSYVKIIDGATPTQTVTPFFNFGPVFNASSVKVAISNTGRDAVITGVGTDYNVFNKFWATSDSGASWFDIYLPDVTHNSIVYSGFSSPGIWDTAGLGDVFFQPSVIFDNHPVTPKLHIFTYQENTSASQGPAGDPARLVVVDHVYTPPFTAGAQPSSSNVLFVADADSECNLTVCSINAAVSDNYLVVLAGRGEWWDSQDPTWTILNAQHPQYAIIDHSGNISKGWIGDGEYPSSGFPESMSEIGLAYMGLDSLGREQFAFVRGYNQNSHGGVNWAVSKLSIVDSGSGPKFPDTYHYPGYDNYHPQTAWLTTLNSSDLAQSGVGTTDLDSVLGLPIQYHREFRTMVAKRYDPQERVTVFLYGALDPVTGYPELSDVRSVTFTPGSPAGQAVYHNDYTVANATAQGQTLYIDPTLFTVNSAPSGEIFTWFTGSVGPNPFLGKAYLEIN